MFRFAWQMQRMIEATTNQRRKFRRDLEKVRLHVVWGMNYSLEMMKFCVFFYLSHPLRMHSKPWRPLNRPGRS